MRAWTTRARTTTLGEENDDGCGYIRAAPMKAPAPGGLCYLVEWYRRECVEKSMAAISAKLDESAASLCAEGSPVHLVTMLAVPADEVVFAVFAASSEDLVAQVCNRAGVPADRLSAAACTAV